MKILHCALSLLIIIYFTKTTRADGEQDLNPRKRPFCNAFTGCGRKRGPYGRPQLSLPELYRMIQQQQQQQQQQEQEEQQQEEQEQQSASFSSPNRPYPSQVEAAHVAPPRVSSTRRFSFLPVVRSKPFFT